jgi:branched-chain amino acid transport system permease protein
VIDVIITGVTLGCIYALVAIGFTLVYRTTGVVSFANGAFVMLGGVGAGWAIEQWHVSLLVAGLFGVALAAAAGLLLAAGIIVPLWWRKAQPFVLILATALYLVVLQSVALSAFGSDPLEVPPIIHGDFHVFGRVVQLQNVVIVVASIVLFGLLFTFLQRTRLGTAMRAGAADRDVGRLMGISPFRMTVLAVVVSAALGGLAGLLVAPVQFASYTVAVNYTVRGFIAAVVGGLGDLRGAVVGGLVVGFIEAFAGIYLSTRYLDVILVGLVFCVLMVRPHGLFTSAASLEAK